MKNYKTTYGKHFKTVNGDGITVKIAVMYTDIFREVGEPGVYIQMRALTENDMAGWDVIKEFKGKNLYQSHLHIRLSSLIKVLDMLDEIQNDVKNLINESYQ